MSADHRRPLFAFVLVLVVCVIIMVNGLKGQAVVVALRTGAGHVVKGVELVTTRGDHGQQLMEPPVLRADATTVPAAPPSTPAAPASPAPSTTPTPPAGGHAHAHAQQPATPAQPHAAGHAPGSNASSHAEHARDEGRGRRSHASQGSAHQVVHGLSQQLEQLLGVHEDTGPSRGPGVGETRGHGDVRGADDGRGRGGRGHDRGHHLGQLLGRPHDLLWARHR